MKDTRFGLWGRTWGQARGQAWLCLAATVFLVQGCDQQKAAERSGTFAIDMAGAARVCSAPAASPGDGQTVAAQMQVSNEGGWCGINANRGGAPLATYLVVGRPAHGKVFAHRVGTNTRIDYTPDRGYVGTDHFSVRLVPGDAVIQAGVNVTP